MDRKYIIFGRNTGNVLEIAAFSGNSQVIETLLEHGENININNTDFFDAPPLILAIVNDAVPADTIETFIKHGADVNIKKSNDGNTQLMFATVSRNPNSPQIIEVLLKHGANVNAKNNRGETAADIAKRINRQDILSILEKYQ